MLYLENVTTDTLRPSRRERGNKGSINFDSFTLVNHSFRIPVSNDSIKLIKEAGILIVPKQKDMNILGGIDIKINVFARNRRDGSPRKKQNRGIIGLLCSELNDSSAS